MLLNQPISTERLNLRLLGPEDATDTYLGWMRNPEVLRFLEARFEHQTTESLVQFIDHNNRSPDTLLLGMCLNETGRHIGNIKLGPIVNRYRHAPIGIMVGDRSCWGKGFAAEAIAGLADYAAREMELHRVFAACFANNGGSVRAFIKAGFEEEGRLRSHCRDGDTWVDAVTLGKVLE